MPELSRVTRPERPEGPSAVTQTRRTDDGASVEQPMIGYIRFVNPDRGTVPAALSGRLLNFRLGPSGTAWEIVALEGGCHYQPGRSFTRLEFQSWTEARDPGPRPEEWEWRVFGPWGVDRLKVPPDHAELVAAAAEALRIGDPAGLNCLDTFEVWAADNSSGRPLALLATSFDYLQAEAIGFSPGPTGRSTNRYNHTGQVWRFCDPHDLFPQAEAFQRRVNEKIRKASQPGLYPFTRRIFEHRPDGSVIEYDLGRPRAVASEFLPRGQLAEPLESERIALLRILRGAEEPGRPFK